MQALDHLLAAFPDASFGHELSVEQQLMLATKSTADWDCDKEKEEREKEKDKDRRPMHNCNGDVNGIAGEEPARVAVLDMRPTEQRLYPISSQTTRRSRTPSPRALTRGSNDIELGGRYRSETAIQPPLASASSQRSIHSSTSSRSSETAQVPVSPSGPRTTSTLFPQLLTGGPQLLRASAGGLEVVDGSSKPRRSSAEIEASDHTSLMSTASAPKSPQLSNRSSIAEARARFFATDGVPAPDGASENTSRNSNLSTTAPDPSPAPAPVAGDSRQPVSLSTVPVANAGLSAPKASFGARHSIDGRLLVPSTSNGNAPVGSARQGSQVDGTQQSQSTGRATEFELATLSSQVSHL